MSPMSVMIKPVSGNCNLRCSYCFYYDTMKNREQYTYGVMSEDTLETIVRKVLENAKDVCSFVFQGGEPTLRGLRFYKRLVHLEKKYNIHNVRIKHAIQTNGYEITKEWATLFKDEHFLVGLSLDGVEEIQDAYRITECSKPSFRSVMNTIALFQQEGVIFNILSVVHKQSAAYVKENYAFFKEHNLSYLQFIPCLDPMGSIRGGASYSLTPKDYGVFLVDLFELWYQDILKGRNVYIRQFDNYIRVLLGYQAEACDMLGTCSIQYAIEANGSVYPCDFYMIEEKCLGNLTTDSIKEVDKKREEIRFIEESHHLKEYCNQCSYYIFCKGGCRRNQEQGSFYFCESYQYFFQRCLGKLIKVAKAKLSSANE